MRIALTGATGIVGGFIAHAVREAGHHLNPLPDYRLGDRPDLTGHDALIHAAFAHAPGRYRGGEGDDHARFRRLNLNGTLRLFDAAVGAGVSRVVFLSSRAVHDGQPAGTALFDDLSPSPTTLYGEVKALAEAALADLPIASTSLRATGIYGPGRGNKWRDLFGDYLAGHPIAARIATEVHGEDLAAAALLALREDAPATLNVSDLVLDRRDLLAEVAQLTGCAHPLPPRADATTLRLPDCSGLARLGWRPGGMTKLRASLPRMLDPTRHL
ncbi:NAD-dependent epimerase/dehydratase family protein [Paracoccus tegillarcae]|uniref:NAD-dependent dehydratase n=1 Tax=Paracoccus tegillarcae TaxID=1529068 RepID=A0A2K9EHC6_9RHOB|nr:NAD(P)-dependent oxidoreductase [Paracoccus tegillarcae]AUH34388.1 NAD-dependent dehydratase [Paracoccus tegillarcae]